MGLRSLLSPSDRTLNQLIKGFYLVLYNAILIARENSKLRTANKKQKQKRTRLARHIAYEGDLSVREARKLRTEPTRA